jgi:hypothetical protein
MDIGLARILAVLALAATAPAGAPAAPPAHATPVPVLVELYTSEGCSSCPPADAVLTDLSTEQPVPGVRVIALGEHVDYWNALGWVDRFSSAAFTQRQSDYQARAFPDSPVYTPQLVVDGRLQCVGSDAAAVQETLRQAARSPKAALDVAVRNVGAQRADIAIDIDVPATVSRDGPADIVVAVVEDGLVTRVERGENRGRTLEHSAVVRRLRAVGELTAQQANASVTATVPLADDWSAQPLRVVAFVQERRSRRVLGATESRLEPGP